MFELSQLQCFVAVAEELHFGRAATKLGMTQPPLSRQVQILEHHLDARLFERTSRAVKLTPAGRSFLPEARRILRLAESSALLAKRIARGKTGALKIGFTAASAYDFLPRLITACQKSMPDIDLSLKEMVSGDQLEALQSDQIDIGFLRPPVVRPDLNAIQVYAENLQLASPAAHPLARKKRVTILDLDDQPFVMYAPYESRYFYDLLVAQFAQANIRPVYVQHLGQIHSILSLVRAGLGHALVPQSAASLRVEGVIMRPVPLQSRTQVELFAVCRRDHDQLLLSGLIELARQITPRRAAGR
jgi:DNA-binding transcriptional LysR family regulator